MNVLFLGLLLMILFLSTGMYSADAVKAKGTYLPEINSDKVCGDRLCSEISQETKEAKSQMSEQEDPAVEDKGEESVMDDSPYTITNVVGNIHVLTDGRYNSMFIPTGEGVIVFDAPNNFGENLVELIQGTTGKSVTHLVYSHAHKDHIGAAHVFGDGVTIIAHEETKAWLERSNDSQRPIPDIAFSDQYTLELGDTIVELSYKGPAHVRGNIFSYIPEYKTLFLVDHVQPGWVPFYALGISEDIGAYMDAYEWILEYDFEYFVPGHGMVGDRDDVLLHQKYVMDLRDSALDAIQTVDYAEATANVDPHGYNVFDAYLTTLADRCAKLSDDTWRDVLIGTDTWTESSCKRMILSIFVD